MAVQQLIYIFIFCTFVCKT